MVKVIPFPASGRGGCHLTLGREVSPHPHFPLPRDHRGWASRIGVPNARQATRPRCLWRSLDHQQQPPAVGDDGMGRSATARPFLRAEPDGAQYKACKHPSRVLHLNRGKPHCVTQDTSVPAFQLRLATTPFINPQVHHRGTWS